MRSEPNLCNKADDVDKLVFRQTSYTDVSSLLTIASETNGHVEFDFGGGNVFVVKDTTIAALSDDILIYA